MFLGITFLRAKWLGVGKFVYLPLSVKLYMCFLFFKYSQLSLSRLRLFRITAYLEEKIWSLFKHRNFTSANKILRTGGEIAPEEQFLPFLTIFSIYISN